MKAQHKSDIIILGGGLTGLTLAYLLKQNNISTTILEAKSSIGGRIHTTNQSNEAPIELGATWISEQHHTILKLIKTLGLNVFSQTYGAQAIYEPFATVQHQLVTLPPNNESSFKIAGGTSALINRLFKSLNPQSVLLDHKVEQIKKIDQRISIITNQGNFDAKKVISTLPPNLLINTVRFSPPLPELLSNIAQKTHTWMGESIKVAFTYNTPFWRQDGLSGTIYSNAGPITEMYDHSNFEDSHHALMGFFNGAYFLTSQAERKALALAQLKKYYGNSASDFISYHEKVWRADEYIFSNYKYPVSPHQNNGHAVFQKPYLNGLLYIGGTETSVIHPGYMEGAILSAITIFNQLKG